MKQMSLIEMDGFLKGQCIPRDLKVNETNAEYLVRKFGELESKLETALRECRSAGITIDNLEAKCAALAAENVALRSKAAELAYEASKIYSAYNATITEPDGDFMDMQTLHEMQCIETPATDAFMAEVRAQARTDFIGRIEWIIRNECNPDKTETILNELQSFSNQLRKGGNQ
ncbi:hypothetical protein [Escherichia coli]|uniref:hypothetical protein n=1 Tax=Escherichia coli TaxID=562 RepID=UPI0009287A86|nr:hypothetical protein [Escherichia coli]OJM03526.1 hypothetical protein BK274_20720 [Escherichia coli]